MQIDEVMLGKITIKSHIDHVQIIMTRFEQDDINAWRWRISIGKGKYR